MHHLTRLACLVMFTGAALGQQSTLQQPQEPKGKQDTKHVTPTTKPTQTVTKQNTTKQPEVQSASQKANEPAREHVELANWFIGEWNTTWTSWAQPTSQPVSTTGKARFYATIGGRFVASEFDGQFQNMPFKGMGLLGYNNGEKRFENVWIDSGTTAILFFTGTHENNTYNWNSTYTDPTNGEHKTLRATNTFQDRNTMTYSLFETTSGGQEFKTMEINYTRTGPGTPMELTPIENKVKNPNTPNNGVNKNTNTPNTPNTTTTTNTPKTTTTGHN